MTHVYTKPGFYHITVRGTDSNGTSKTETGGFVAGTTSVPKARLNWRDIGGNRCRRVHLVFRR